MAAQSEHHVDWLSFPKKHYFSKERRLEILQADSKHEQVLKKEREREIKITTIIKEKKINNRLLNPFANRK